MFFLSFYFFMFMDIPYLMVGSVDQLEPDKILLLLDIMVAASHNKNYSSALKGNRAGHKISVFTLFVRLMSTFLFFFVDPFCTLPLSHFSFHVPYLTFSCFNLSVLRSYYSDNYSILSSI
jgi:hypothetical protein